MRRYGRGRLSLRDQRIAVKRSLDHMADMAGKPRMQIDIPPKRVQRPMGASGKPLERDVIRAVRELLACHPNVALAIRQNSGALYDARGIPIKFYEIIRAAEDITITDFWGILKIRGDFIPMAIECKAPGWKRPTNEREEKQANYIGWTRAIGGRAGFATSATQAVAIIEGTDTK